MTRRPLFSAALAWLAGILILASGCMDQSPTATILEPTTVSRAAVAPTGVSAVRAAAPYQAGSVSQTITPAGGSIDFGIGTIVFPSHAVQRATVITATVDGETMAVEFGPHLVFDQAQPTLCFDAAGIDLTATTTVIHVRDDGSSNPVAHSVVGTQVCVAPESFSKFILAAE
jgi:hypothetical protein